jgi:membrane fusion protein (multidrug efflux system)
VQQGAQGKFVFVVGADSKAEARPVEVGDWLGQDWVIESGLKAGDRVIVDGTAKVQPAVRSRSPSRDRARPERVERRAAPEHRARPLRRLTIR